MTEKLETVIPGNGVHIHLVPGRKFKTVSITAKFRAPLSRDTITKRALLPYVLQQGTLTYPDRSAMQAKLDALYGAVLSVDSSKKGNNHIITIRLETANQKFISDEASIMDEAVNLLKEVIFHPISENEAFLPSVVDREKSTLQQKMNSIVDDKMRYANMRLIDKMCSNERYGLHIQGYEDDLKSITAENLYAYYQSVLKTDQLDIYVSGDFESDVMEEKIKSEFERECDWDSKEAMAEPNSEKQSDGPNEMMETQEIQQAKLHFGYRTHITYADNDYAALHVFNGLFGGFPSSKLFINVREKNSLAYYAASKFESHKGLLFVFSGIAPEDYGQAREIIEKQLEAMKNGDFTEEEMANTKALIINQLLETMDDSRGLIELLYQQVVADTEWSPLDLIEGIKHVSKKDVVNAANKCDLDTIYLLTSKGGASSE
ncbi:insulinase family protein [Lentibacillus cibarius]|uniref:Insulinase family protein n=1 Tax=Lentibacillus cibarius TaxID=2583219 RepID=A0A549YKQ6_9BACI|nr:pitrilysin family protein [Lentibacillus cibarius]TRM12454.1 insulinase family protein [Lentibacillus cibarius]